MKNGWKHCTIPRNLVYLSVPKGQIVPPIDSVAADGTPAGFNTAILAELGKRMNVNFELVQVDSLGRAAALASGQVDLVFWTNGADGRDLGGRQTKEEHEAILSILNQEQLDLMLSISGGIDYFKTQTWIFPTERSPRSPISTTC